MGATQSSGTATSPATPEVGTASSNSNVENEATGVDADLLLLAVSAERGTFKNEAPAADSDAKAAFQQIDEDKCKNVFTHKFF